MNFFLQSEKKKQARNFKLKIIHLDHFKYCVNSLYIDEIEFNYYIFTKGKTHCFNHHLFAGKMYCSEFSKKTKYS